MISRSRADTIGSVELVEGPDPKQGAALLRSSREVFRHAILVTCAGAPLVAFTLLAACAAQSDKVEAPVEGPEARPAEEVGSPLAPAPVSAPPTVDPAADPPAVDPSPPAQQEPSAPLAEPVPGPSAAASCKTSGECMAVASGCAGWRVIRRDPALLRRIATKNDHLQCMGGARPPAPRVGCVNATCVAL